MNQKIFCVGLNKTGTTSLTSFFRELGYKVAPQREGEKLVYDWGERNFSEILKLAKKDYQFFQDAPFSLPLTYRVLFEEFPDAKYILTERDNVDVWYESLRRFHTKKFGNESNPTKKDLLNAHYYKKGYAYKAHKLMFKTPDEDLYNERILKSYYINHNEEVKSFFESRGGKFICINLSEAGVDKKLLKFLGIENSNVQIPWLNRS